MRNRNEQNGLEATVITGSYGALISIRVTNEQSVNKPDFLGFAIKRDDLTEQESYPLRGFKYFVDSDRLQTKGQLFDTDKQPVQSFFWEDFSVKPQHDYVYHLIPVYGIPKNLQYGPEVTVSISSENVQGSVHSVHFNMGVAGSLAYARRFDDKRPDQMNEDEKRNVRKWLSRGLEEALLGFIQKAIQNKFGLRIAFYEFTYSPVLLKLKEAIEAGCHVEIVYDSRQEEEENDQAIDAADLPRTAKTSTGVTYNVLHRRTKDPQVPSHNKFMILMNKEVPVEIWFGSTNITDKGILGHSNVGHHIVDKALAKKYFDYWECLATDPSEADIQVAVDKIQGDIANIPDFKDNYTPFFSPRAAKTVLETYGKFIAGANQMVCGIFPFSFSKVMKASLSTPNKALKYLMVDKYKNAAGIIKDKNTLIVNGAYFSKPMFDWLEEINSGILLNKHPNPYIGTNYVHNKVLLIDPLTDNAVIIVGSANFSDPSVTSNDENTVVIKGGYEMRRICDIYFTEFYRIFHHFFVRVATQEINKDLDLTAGNVNNPLHLKTDNSWVAQFRQDHFKIIMQEQMRLMPLDYGQRPS
ncbi:phospholipase D-like domain-containing protein [Mucilaginibacter sabulilitoris]|uniref:phospholipase D n=1 Tax=Mucilaginibacter sabulilitoris TaxID=1173583 RepID=A0ABZ0TNH8_9SPHI|nr:phospholipase D-like domain-containing protein [Mucilaginibacter sabulilitoris]WPU94706.1 phospholipase D-like domain-containing protein [Mucilaginibacter sabulilitoris]